MDKVLRVKFQYNSGDLIATMPGLKSLYDKNGVKTIVYQELGLPAFYFDGIEHPVKDESGKQVCMNRGMFDLLYPLVKSQDYIEDFAVWKGQEIDWDMAKTRDSRSSPMPMGSIFHWPFMSFPDLTCDVSMPWIEVKDSPNVGWLSDKIIINRTERYTNPHISYFFLKDFLDKTVFIGTFKEFEIFKKQYDLPMLGRLNYDNFLQYAEAIKNCKLFIGNQSLFWQIAHGMGKISILELCREFPNCWPVTDNGHSFIHQEALEHIFKKLVN